MKKIWLIISIVILFVLSCTSVEINNLAHYSYTTIDKMTVYYEFKPTERLINDYVSIHKNITAYFTGKLNIEIYTGPIEVALLPLENDVIDFQKNQSTATCLYNKKIILLADFHNLDEEIYTKYGDPPVDIYETSFTHEITHAITLPQIKFSKSLHMKERIANFCSFIDFRNSEFVLYQTNSNFQDSLAAYYSEKKINDLFENGLEVLETYDSTELSIFMIYLHLNERYDLLKSLILSSSLKKFIDSSDWKEEDLIDFIRWVKSYDI